MRLYLNNYIDNEGNANKHLGEEWGSNPHWNKSTDPQSGA